MTGEILLYFAIAFIGIALSAVFSGMETGLYTINKVRLTVRSERGERAARRIRSLIERPGRMLATLLIGNNAANYAGSFGIAAILDLSGVLPVSAILINVCILVPVLFIFGETLPKDLFRTHTDRWSYAMAGFLTWSDRVLTWTGLTPIVHGFGSLVARFVGSPSTLPGTARERISHLIKEGVAAGVLSEAQTTLADRALALREVRVIAETVPWRDVVAIPVNADDETRRRLMERHPFSRLPVLDEKGRPIGVLSTLDALLEPERSTRDLMQPVVVVESRQPVREALRQMREAGAALAIVAGRKRGREEGRGGPPLGIVTFKDLIEPLTGELRAW